MKGIVRAKAMMKGAKTDRSERLNAWVRTRLSSVTACVPI